MKPRRLLRLEPGMPAENRPPASAAPRTAGEED